MPDWVTAGLGLLLASVLAVLCVAFVAAVPWVSFQALCVVVRREWLPPVYALRSLVKRQAMVLGTLAGLGLVVFVLTTILMLAEGIRHTLVSTGAERNAKVMLKGVHSEGQSFLTRPQLTLLGVLPQAAASKDGKPLVAPEALVLVWATAAGSDPEAGANLYIRGASEASLKLNPLGSLKGRLFKPGAFEIVIGRNVEGKFTGATLGGRMHLAGRDWEVVGIADRGGNAYDSEVWTDLDQVRSTFKREASIVTFSLANDSDIASVQALLSATPLLSNLQVRREADYWESIGRRYVDFVKLMGGLVGVVFGFAAVLGAMNTMNAQVTSRTRELGALRAIGFKSRSVLTSLVLESMVLGAFGGVLGVCAAWLLQGLELKLTSLKTMTEMSYALHLTLPVALICIGVAVFVGFAGGLAPALRASRMRIVDAVRAE